MPNSFIGHLERIMPAIRYLFPLTTIFDFKSVNITRIKASHIKRVSADDDGKSVVATMN